MPREAPSFATEAVLPTRPWNKEPDKKEKPAPKRRGRPPKKK